MNFLSRIKNAYSALLGYNDGFIPIGGGSPGGVQFVGNDEAWMSVAAYFACIRNISEDIGKLPLITYQRMEKGKERARDHYYHNLLRYRPHPSYGAMSFRETVTRYAMGWGNGYAHIVRNNVLLDNGANQAVAFEIKHPSHVSIEHVDEGKVEYLIREPGKEEKVVASEDMIHIHGLSSNGVEGLSIAGFARETLDFALYSQKYGSNVFKRGGRPSGILTHPGKLKDDAKEGLRKSWDDAYGGKNSGKTAVLDHGIKYESIAANPIDVQFIETRQFSVEEIARWFRMPLHKIQYLVRAQGWSTLDAQNTDYLTDTLLSWLTRWEEELLLKLFYGTEYFASHLVISLLRGDLKSRAIYYGKMWSIGVLSINDIRALEDMNPIPGGDQYRVPLNTAPVDKAEENKMLAKIIEMLGAEK